VDVEAVRTIASNVWRKPTELHRVMSAVKFADMVFVVVASSFGLCWPHRHQRLTAVQCLNLRLSSRHRTDCVDEKRFFDSLCLSDRSDSMLVSSFNPQEIVPTLPGSSLRRFNVSSRVARKGNGKNLATRFATAS